MIRSVRQLSEKSGMKAKAESWVEMESNLYGLWPKEIRSPPPSMEERVPNSEGMRFRPKPKRMAE